MQLHHNAQWLLPTSPKPHALDDCAGICTGVILTEIASVLIFPASATGEALRHMRTALNKLAELNSMTWQYGPVSPRKPHNGQNGEAENSASGGDSRWLLS